MQFIFLHRYSWYTFCRVFSLLVNLDLKNDKDNVKAHSGDGGNNVYDVGTYYKPDNREVKISRRHRQRVRERQLNIAVVFVTLL